VRAGAPYWRVTSPAIVELSRETRGALGNAIAQRIEEGGALSGEVERPLLVEDGIPVALHLHAPLGDNQRLAEVESSHALEDAEWRRHHVEIGVGQRRLQVQVRTKPGQRCGLGRARGKRDEPAVLRPVQGISREPVDRQQGTTTRLVPECDEELAGDLLQHRVPAL